MSSQISVRDAGSLELPEARELLAVRGVAGAYGVDGGLDPDTPRLWGRRSDGGPDHVPESISSRDVIDIREEEVVWGGGLSGHYGHFLMESVARLWPLLPDAKLEGVPAVFVNHRRSRFASEWLEAFGVQTVTLPPQGPVRFKRMFVPEPACRLNVWVAPDLRDIHLHARQGMNVPARTHPKEVLWLSRSGLDRHRAAYDECMLEWILSDHVSIIRPEAMTLAEQVGAIEGSRAVSGVLGSAFHTMFMATGGPMVVALCPAQVAPTFFGQDQLLGGGGVFVHALATAGRSQPHGGRFPGSYRILIPEALRALSATVLPALREDPRAVALSFPERRRLSTGDGPEGDDIEAAVTRVLLDPLSVEARMALGAAFEANDADRCALEQFLMAADLAADHAYAPMRAARILHRMGRSQEASTYAKRVLAIDPRSSEALRYVTDR